MVPMSNMRTRVFGTKQQRADGGFTTLELVIIIIITGIIMMSITALIMMIVKNQSSATAERSQVVAVKNALETVSESIDESASIYYATETELGIARNVTNEVSGGIDCRLDQFYVGTVGSDEDLRQWTTVNAGACLDNYPWTAMVAADTGSIVHLIEPFTLVDGMAHATAACTATQTSAERGGGDDYCVPLFRYLDGNGQEFAPLAEPVRNSVSAVMIVMSATVGDSSVPASYSRTVSPNNYVPTSIIGDVAVPMCPATLSRTLVGTDLTLNWAPVPNASSYRIVRTFDGVTATLATLTVASMACLLYTSPSPRD